jgi:hypothetical protein
MMWPRRSKGLSEAAQFQDVSQSGGLTAACFEKDVAQAKVCRVHFHPKRAVRAGRELVFIYVKL